LFDIFNNRERVTSLGIEMLTVDPVEMWLDSVDRSHSNSRHTRIGYLQLFVEFLSYVGTTAEQILNDYDVMDEKQFKRKYTPIINSYVASKAKANYAPSSQLKALSAVKSFFKYNSLPLNFIPTVNPMVVFHNRDITKEEIEEIVRNSQPREKAFYALMVQSGLRPNEICNLKVEDFEQLLSGNTPIPCLIQIRQEATKGKYSSYFSFAGKEAIDYIKEYFKRDNRTVTLESYVFTKDDGESQTDTDLISHLFRRTVTRLKKEHKLNFKNKESEIANRNELRLYNLRKYFRNHAGQAGQDYVNFWMGHSLGVDGHYFSGTDTEMHRNKYIEKAMPNLRIEEKAPGENEQVIITLQKELKSQRVENEALRKEVEEMRKMITPLLALAELVKKSGDVWLTSMTTGKPVGEIGIENDKATKENASEKER
jgi:integrase